MFSTLLLREIQDHLHTARVGIALAGMGLLAVAVALVGATEYARRVEVYEQAVAGERSQLDEARGRG